MIQKYNHVFMTDVKNYHTFFIALLYPKALELENFNIEIFLFLSPLNSAEK